MNEAFDATLGENTSRLLREIGSYADKSGFVAYLVGGAVRDLLLGLASDDLDIVIEGDVEVFVKGLVEDWKSRDSFFVVPGKPILFRKYLTAKLPLKTSVRGIDCLDFAAARTETYSTSGAQPVVSLGNVELDLKRRDFSINAMALNLSQNHFGELLDLFDGQEHLKLKELYILHRRSFEDDPARLIRGVRYSERLGFRFAPETKALAEEAIKGGFLFRLPRFRLFDEFRKALNEPCWYEVVSKLNELGMLKQIGEKLEVPAEKQNWARWQQRFLALCSHLSDDEIRKELESFGLMGKAVESVLVERQNA